MTRENKLALVVGFGLILIVGILVSDHFSVAAQQQAATLGGVIEDPLGTAGRDVPRLVEYGDPALTRQRGEAQLALHTAQIPLDEHRPSDSAQQPQSAGLPYYANPPQYADQPQYANRTHFTDPALHGAPIIGMPDLQANGNAALGNQQTNLSVRSDAAAANSSEIPGFVPLRPNEPSFTLYHIRAGDSLTSICRANYGDASLVSKLAAFNGITDRDTVQAGMRIRLPNKAALTGEANGASPRMQPPAAGTPPATPPVRETPPARPTSTKTYTVASGDTLSEISQKVMGTSKKWRTLYEFNRDIIKDPNNLLVGTVIKVPTS